MAKRGPDSSERALNLAMYLASSDQYVTLDDILAHVEGYDTDADYASIQRMFEHDKDFLRSCGLMLVTDEDDSSRYTIDAAASFAGELDLLAHEAATMRVVGSLMLQDPSFPLKSDLRLALAKLAESLGGTGAFIPNAAEKTPDAPAGPAEVADPSIVALCARAIDTRKELSFSYPVADKKSRTTLPYALFSYEAAWYLVAYDHSNHDVRVFNCARIHGAEINTKHPKTPDFEIPRDFDVSRYRGLPFQYGTSDPVTAVVTFAPEVAWQAKRLTQGVGDIEERDDGSARWTVTVRDRNRFLGWILSNGPGLSIMPPQEMIDPLREHLEEVARLHG